MNHVERVANMDLPRIVAHNFLVGVPMVILSRFYIVVGILDISDILDTTTREVQFGKDVAIRCHSGSTASKISFLPFQLGACPESKLYHVLPWILLLPEVWAVTY